MTPKAGIFKSTDPFLFEVALIESSQTDTQKLKEQVEFWGEFIGIIFKLLFVVAFIAKIVLDIIFQDAESQGFLISLIIGIRMLNRLRFFNSNFGIAANAFFSKMGDAAFTQS